MNFLEATKLLKEGKKIRRKKWLSDVYITSNEKTVLVNNKGEHFIPAIETILDNNWELHGEKKVITKKGFCWHCGSKENLTRHHLQLKEYRKTPKEGAVTGTIPLCKDCHEGVEQLRTTKEKVFKSRHKAFFIDYIEKTHILTEKQRPKMLKQVKEMWGNEI